MELHVTPDQAAFIQQAVNSGRISGEQEAAREAFGLWEERERARLEVLAALEEAERSLGLGKGRTITRASMNELAENISARGHARLAAESSPTR